MCKVIIKSGACIFCLCFYLCAQLPAVGLPQQTGPIGSPANLPMLQNILIEVDSGAAPGENVITTTFEFAKKPNTYFYYFMHKPNRLVFDFYDTRPNKEPLYLVTEPPFLSCKIESLQIDINKDVTGLQPDIKNITRITFISKYEIDFNVAPRQDHIVFSYNWSYDKIKQKKFIIAQKSYWWAWTLVAVGIAGGGGTAAYFLNAPPPPVEKIRLSDPNDNSGLKNRPTPSP
jgi:hypothetical protein